MTNRVGGYIMVDCTGIDLTTGDTPITVPGIWDIATAAMKSKKPIVAEGLTYGDAPVTPVNCFGWVLADDEIVFVSATIHVHIKDDNTVTTIDVAA